VFLGRTPGQQRVPETRAGRTRLSASRPSPRHGASVEAMTVEAPQAGANVGNKER
jgi:hypothetical protein